MAEIILAAIDQERARERKRSDHLSRLRWQIDGSPGLGRCYLVLFLSGGKQLVSKPFVKLPGHLVLHLLWLFLFNFLPLKNKRSGEQMMVILQVSLDLKKDSFFFNNGV